MTSYNSFPGALEKTTSPENIATWTNLGLNLFRNIGAMDMWYANNYFPILFSKVLEVWQQFHMSWAFLVAKMVKSLPEKQEAQIWFLGWEVPLEKEISTHSSVLAWRIPWMEKPVRLQSMGSQSRTQLSDSTYLLNIS